MVTFLENRGIIVQEILNHEWQIKTPKGAEIVVPKEFDHIKSVLIDYLKENNGQQFVHKSIQKLFEMSAQQTNLLTQNTRREGRHPKSETLPRDPKQRKSKY